MSSTSVPLGVPVFSEEELRNIRVGYSEYPSSDGSGDTICRLLATIAARDIEIERLTEESAHRLRHWDRNAARVAQLEAELVDAKAAAGNVSSLLTKRDQW